MTGSGVVPDIRVSGRQGTSGGYDNIIDGETQPRQVEGTDFGMIPVGSPVTRWFKVTNDGTHDLKINSTSFNGGAGAEFSVSGLRTGALGPGESDEFTITWQPTRDGTRSTTFWIVSDDPDENPYDFVLSGQAVVFPNIRVRGLQGAIPTDIDDGDHVADQQVTDFGTVNLGETGTRTYRILNEGNATLNIASITSNSARFTIPGPPVTVDPGDRKDFVINFNPNTRGTVFATITIENDTPGDEGSYTFAIKGTGAGPEIVVEGIDSGARWVNINDGSSRPDARLGTLFADTLVAGGTTPRNFRIRNTGDEPLRIDGRSFSGLGSREFSVSGLFGGNPFAEIAPGRERVFTITFNPSSAGSRQATFSMDTNDASEDPFTFEIGGTGISEPDIRVAGITVVGGVRIPSEINPGDLTPDQNVTQYGEVNPGTVGTRLFRVYNDGDLDLSITSITSSDAAFNIPGPPRSVRPGQHTDFVIDFTPPVVGRFDTTITIDSNDPDRSEAPYRFALTGSGRGPEISVYAVMTNGLDPDTLIEIPNGFQDIGEEFGTDLGAENVGANTVGRGFSLFQINNTGTTDLDIGSLRFTGSGAAHFDDFGLSGASRTIRPGGSQRFSIYFVPTSAGGKLATIEIANNDGDEDPFTFRVFGEGVEEPSIRVEGPTGDLLRPWQAIGDRDEIPSADDGTDFTALPIAGESITRTFRIENDGTQVLTINSIRTDYPDDFAIVDVPRIVNPGSNATFDVVFDPTNSGFLDATLTVESDAWHPNDEQGSEPTLGIYTFAIRGYGWDNVSPRMRVGGRFNDGYGVIIPAGLPGMTFGNPLGEINFYPFWHPVEHNDTQAGFFNGTNFGTIDIRVLPPFELGDLFDFNSEPTKTSHFRIWNEGAEPMRISSLTLPSPHFSLGVYWRSWDDYPNYHGYPARGEIETTIPPGGHLTFTVVFRTDSPGRHYGQVLVESDSNGPNPYVINLTGFADNGDDGPELVIDTPETFRALAGESHTRSAFILNSGNEVLTLLNVSSSDPSQFEILDAPASVAPGTVGEIVIRYNASTTSTAEVEATITFNTNDPDDGESLASFRVRGEPGAPSLRVYGENGALVTNGLSGADSGLGTDFGSGDAGGQAIVRQFELRNLDDQATLNLQSVSTGSANFVIESAPSSIPPEGSALLSIAYHPRGDGMEEATFAIHSDDPNNGRYTFTIAGTSIGEPEPPRIVGFDKYGSYSLISFTNSATKTYAIQYSTDLSRWLPLHSGIAGNGTVKNLLVGGYGNQSRVYFRVEEE